MKKFGLLILLLSVLLILSACDQEQLDLPSSSDPTSGQTVPTTTSEPETECVKHKFPEGANLCSVCGADYFSETLTFTLSETGDSYIVSDIGTCKRTSILIPATYEGLPVTEIGEHAFEGNTEERLFCLTITEVTLPLSINKIGEAAFYRCRALKKFVVPEGVTEIQPRTFSECWAMESITLPNSLTRIGIAAFYQCRTLQTIDIPEGVTAIENTVFSGCSALTELTLPSGITSIGEGMVSGCKSLETIKIPDLITEIPARFASRSLGLKSVECGENVIRIGESAFGQCSALQSVVLGEKLESIGDFAFSNCTSLETIALPESLKHIGKEAFVKCAFRTIELPDGLESVDPVLVFSNCNKLEYTEYQGMGYVGSQQNPYLVLVCRLDSTVKDVVMHKDTRFVQNTVLQEAEIRSLTIGESMEHLPMSKLLERRKPSKSAIEIKVAPGSKYYHIAGNCLIETVSKTLVWAYDDPVIPDDGSVTVIGRGAFSHDENLISVIIPDCVEEIGVNAFEYCNNLKIMVVGSGIKALGHDVIIQDKLICQLYYHGTPEQWEEFKKSTNNFYMNYSFSKCTRYYYSETAPTDSGNYWHYVDGKPTLWETAT